jgi:phospholipase C
MLPGRMSDPAITRRTLLRGAAGGAAILAANGLPAWARPIGRRHGIRLPDSLPFPGLPPGTPSMPEIEHVVVLMMENHSFDNILGLVRYQVPGRRDVDGLCRHRGRFLNFNLDAQGNKIRANHAATPCQDDGVPSQSWNASHEAWDGGRNDGFVRASGPVAMWFWDGSDLPFTYSLVKHFPLGQRYFCSVLAQTYPNRRFLFAATASGTISTTTAGLLPAAANGTIFDRLDAHAIDWRVYYEDLPSPLILPNFRNNPSQVARTAKFDQFLIDAAAGNLPQFTLLDPNYGTTSEENPQDIQVGEQYVAQAVNALIQAPTWPRTALFITYDEHGGYYDHVPPPPAIKPDSIPPLLNSGDLPGAYDRYGFRVPLVVVSPWARRRYVSSRIQDHASITAFIERKWNLPAMTFRDANAEPMIDYFDFHRAAFEKPPRLASAPPLAPGLARCKAAGQNPPLPPGVSERADVARYLLQFQRR